MLSEFVLCFNFVCNLQSTDWVNPFILRIWLNWVYNITVVSFSLGLGRAISKALLSAGAVVYALDKVQENLDSLVAEVLQLHVLLFVCLSIFSEDFFVLDSFVVCDYFSSGL